MKITKARLKQIIKEELEVTLTNEEATEMFGEAVGAQLEEQELNEVDMSQVQIIMDAFAQIGINLSAATAIGLMGYAMKTAIDADKEIHKSFDKRRRGFAKPEEPLDEGLETFLSHMNPEDLGLLIKVLGQVAYNFSPAAFGTVAIMAARRIAGLDDPWEMEQEIKRAAEEYAAGNQQMREQEEAPQPKVAGDVARAGEKLGKASGIEAAMAAINTRPEFEQMMMKFIQMVSATKLKPQDVKMGIRNVAKQVLQSK